MKFRRTLNVIACRHCDRGRRRTSISTRVLPFRGNCPGPSTPNNGVGSGNSDQLFAKAAVAIRGLIDAIVLTPAEGALETHVVRRGRRAHAGIEAQDSGLLIELKGNLAAMLGAAVQATKSPDTGDLELKTAMVAGARNPLNLDFSWSAA